MRVIDVRRRDERVQQRLDRRPRLVGAHGAAEQILDHRRVVHLLAFLKREQFVEPQPGEPRGRDRRKVCPRSLHPEDAHLPPRVVSHRLLGGRVAAADVRERPVGPEQVRAIGESVENREARCDFAVPETQRRRNPLQCIEGAAHALTSTAGASRELREPLACLLPVGRSLRLEPHRSERRAHDGTRLFERADLAERHRLHEEIAEHRRLFGAREHRQAGSLRSPGTEKLVSRAAADDVDHCGIDSGDAAEHIDRVGVLQREALEHAAHGLADTRRRRLLRLVAERADPSRHVAGLEEDVGVRIDERAQRRSRPGEGDELLEAVLAALRGPGAATLVQQPEAGDVAQEAVGAPHAALVRQIRREGCVVDQRPLDLDTDERPRADAEEDRSRAVERDRSDCRAGVMRRGCDDGRRSEAGGVGRLRRHRSEQRSRRDDLRKEPRGDVEALEQVGRPVAARRVEALRRRRVRELARTTAAQPVVEEVGDQQQCVRRGERRVVLGRHCRELEHGVDREDLDPGPVVQLSCRHMREDIGRRGGAARVAVVNGALDQPARRIEQAEVDGP